MIDINDYWAPCPFCGEKLLKTATDGVREHWYNGCVLGGFTVSDREKWNRRKNHVDVKRGE